ncbi:MAG: hypothetical protein ACK4IX_07055, partial [Candidatus Sericytochromatia bacterium]
MSLQGIPSSVSSIGPAKLTPKETQASKNPENVIGGAEVRDFQRRTLQLPKTGMAVTSDISPIDDIHPKNKKSV